MKILKNHRLILIALMFCLSFSFYFVANASNLKNAFDVANGNNEDILDKTADNAGYNTGIESGGTDINRTFSTIINLALSFLGIIFLILMLYGGFLWMSDQGNEDQVKKAKDLIAAAIIGLIIVASSYAISWFIINTFGSTALE